MKPKIEFQRPKGMSDMELETLKRDLLTKAANFHHEQATARENQLRCMTMDELMWLKNHANEIVPSLSAYRCFMPKQGERDDAQDAIDTIVQRSMIKTLREGNQPGYLAKQTLFDLIEHEGPFAAGEFSIRGVH